MSAYEEINLNFKFENRELTAVVYEQMNQVYEQRECAKCNRKSGDGVVVQWTVIEITESGVQKSLTSPFAKRAILFLKQRLFDEKYLCFDCYGSEIPWDDMLEG